MKDSAPAFFPAPVELRAVLQPGDAFVLGALHAAEKGSIILDTVADDLAAAVGTDRRQGVNRTLERVEDVLPAIHRHGENFVISVTAHFTLGHGSILQKLLPAGAQANSSA